MRKVLYIFGLLTDADVGWMARSGVRRHVQDGEVLIAEGKPMDSVILLLDGELSVVTGDTGEISRLGVGEIVGEMSYVDSAPPSASVIARGSCLALFLDKAVLTDKLEADVAFACRFYKALAVLLADRLRGTVRRLGYGDQRGLIDDAILEDELDTRILDTISMAGARFQRMLGLLMGAR
jgi:CRP/FNR family transcriptional regulator, cyclic AMP receptor protein